MFPSNIPKVEFAAGARAYPSPFTYARKKQQEAIDHKQDGTAFAKCVSNDALETEWLSVRVRR